MRRKIMDILLNPLFFVLILCVFIYSFKEPHRIIAVPAASFFVFLYIWSIVRYRRVLRELDAAKAKTEPITDVAYD